MDDNQTAAASDVVWVWVPRERKSQAIEVAEDVPAVELDGRLEHLIVPASETAFIARLCAEFGGHIDADPPMRVEVIEAIWCAGWQAFDAGVPFDAVPHSGDAGRYWQNGWRSGKQDRDERVRDEID